MLLGIKKMETSVFIILLQVSESLHRFSSVPLTTKDSDIWSKIKFMQGQEENFRILTNNQQKDDHEMEV